ncbi:YobH family protein, partial [Escherichia sp. SS-MK2]
MRFIIRTVMLIALVWIGLLLSGDWSEKVSMGRSGCRGVGL